MSAVWIGQYVYYLFRAYEFCLLIYILSSWFPQIQDNIIMNFIRDISEPYLSIFRKILPSLGGLDFSPIIAFFVLDLLKSIIIGMIV